MWKCRTNISVENSQHSDSLETFKDKKTKNHNTKINSFMVMFYSYQLISLVLHDQQGNKMANPSKHDILFTDNEACSFPFLTGISAGEAASICKLLNLRSWIIDYVEGWENILAASVTLLALKQLNFVYRKWFSVNLWGKDPHMDSSVSEPK